MATTYKTPGVYVEEIAKLPPSIAPVDTAIPAFIGYTQRAPVDLLERPKRIDSFAEYEQYFGGPQPEDAVTVTIRETSDPVTTATFSLTARAEVSEADRSRHILYYALQLFYANGGGGCYIVPVGRYKPGVGDALDLTELQAGVAKLTKVDEPTLIVIPEAQTLSLPNFAALQADALNQCSRLKDRFVIMDLNGNGVSLNNPAAGLRQAVDDFRDVAMGDALKYGAVYAPNLETVLDYAYQESAVAIVHTKDGQPGPHDGKTLDQLTADHNQLYELARAAIRDCPLTLPPSPAVAGVYARVDAERGVHKAPANTALVGVIKPTIELSNADTDHLNVDPNAGKSINAIRPFVGKGTLVYGARTLTGNDNEWRYVNVRRFFIFVEESVKKATEQFVFEPNDANTWVKVQAMIENFLTTQWRAGALQGVKPEHAFYVSVGLGKTMTPLDILEGRMIIEIGMAAVRPAEFILLRFSHKMAES